MLNASRELLELFGIKSLVPIAPNPLYSIENRSIWTINVTNLTPFSYHYGNQILYAGGTSSYGIKLLNTSRSEVVAYYSQPNIPEMIPAVLMLTYGKGIVLCFPFDTVMTISQSVDHRWMRLIKEALANYVLSLACLIMKPKKFDNPISPFVVPIDENDTLFKETTSVASYLNDLGFSVSYSNLAYNLNSSNYSPRLSLRGASSLFNTVFNTTIRPFYNTTVKQSNLTTISFPAFVQNVTKSLDFLPKPILLWPAGWNLPHDPPSYYRLSPNEDSSDDMNTIAWAPHSVERVIEALNQRQSYGHVGTGVDVAVIDSGFSRNHGYRPYNTSTGYHPFYEEYYLDLLLNRYVPHTYLGSSHPDNDSIGHGTGIVSNLLAVAPGLTLHFIPLDIIPTALTTALNINPDVVSCSWGYDFYEPSPPLSDTAKTIEDAINQLAANGAIVVFAAGNGGFKPWPNSMPTVVSVGGVYVDEYESFQASNYASSFDSSLYRGRHVPDICGLVGQGPDGMLIEMPTQPGSDYDQDFHDKGDGTPSNDGWLVASGTSSAAPQVAGLAAILKELDPDMNVYKFRYYAGIATTDITTGESANGQDAAIGYDDATGYGLINVYETVRRFKEGLFERMNSYKFVPCTETQIFDIQIPDPGFPAQGWKSYSNINLQSTPSSLVLLKIRASRLSTDYFRITFRAYNDITVYMGTSDSYKGHGGEIHAGAKYSPIYDRYVVVPNDQNDELLHAFLYVGKWRKFNPDPGTAAYIYIYKLGEFVPWTNPQTGYKYIQFSTPRNQFYTNVPLESASGTWSTSNNGIPSTADYILYRAEVSRLSSDWIYVKANNGPESYMGSSDSHDPIWWGGYPSSGAWYTPVQTELCFAPYSSSPIFTVNHGGWYNAIEDGEVGANVQLSLDALGYFSQESGGYLTPSYGEIYGFYNSYNYSGIYQQPTGSTTIPLPVYMRGAYAYVVLVTFNRIASDWGNLDINGFTARVGSSPTHSGGMSPGAVHNPVNTKLMFVPNTYSGELHVSWDHGGWYDWKGNEFDRGVSTQILGYFDWEPGAWVSPTGHEDPDNDWIRENEAYDDNEATASGSNIIFYCQWLGYLILTHGPIISYKIRLMVYHSYLDRIVVDVHRNGQWINVFDGTMPQVQWREIRFDEGEVDALRITAHSVAPLWQFPPCYLAVYEADFWLPSS